jgi:hypothetical protein
MPANLVFPTIVLSLGLSGTWLAYKLNLFQWLKKIEDEKRILIPSFVFLLSPFLGVWLISILIAKDNEGVSSETVKLLIPVATFILGQTIAKSEKVEEKKKRKIGLAKNLIYETKKVIKILFDIEDNLRPFNHGKQTSSEVNYLCKEHKLRIDALYEKLDDTDTEFEVIKTDEGIEIISYIEKIKDCASLKILNQEEAGLYKLIEIRLFQVEGYEKIITLIKDFFPDELDNYIDGLNEKKEILEKLKGQREKITRNWKEMSTKERQREPNHLNELYLKYDIDTESEAIQAIDDIKSKLDLT